MKTIINIFIITIALFLVSCNNKPVKKSNYSEGDIVVLKLSNDTVILQYWYSGMWHGRSKINTVIEFREKEINEKLN